MSANRLAPEWAPQDAIAIVWPHQNSDWAPALHSVEPVYLELCKYISRQQTIILIACNDRHAREIRSKLKAADTSCKDIKFAVIPTNDTWIRDYGPVCTVSSGRKILLDFQFDGWGKISDYRLDNALNMQLTKDLGFIASYQSVDHILEAGNIEINSRGELLCSKTCFRRNRDFPDSGFTQLEKQLERWLGCCKIYWLDRIQLIGDDTCGHVDTLARFCADDIIVYTACRNWQDRNHETLGLLSMQLEKINRQSGHKYELIPLPLPDPVFLRGQQLPATYTNFLITNHHVLVPVFNDRQDDCTLRLIDELFPNREVVGVDCRALIQQRGGLHCAAMQIPEGFIL